MSHWGSWMLRFLNPKRYYAGSLGSQESLPTWRRQTALGYFLIENCRSELLVETVCSEFTLLLNTFNSFCVCSIKEWDSAGPTPMAVDSTVSHYHSVLSL